MAVNKTQILQNAQAYAVKGLLDKAIEEWQKLISESPNDGNIYNTIGDLHLKKNALEQAIDAYLKGAEAFHTAGFALKTIAVYKKIIKLSPKRYDVYLKLANVNAERGLTGNAIEDYLAVAKHYSQDGRIKEALDVYRKIANLDPNNTSIRLKLAEMCLREGYEDQAVTEYLQAAKVITESGKTQEAETIYERVLKLDPKNEVARIGLGMVPSPDDSVKQKDLLTKAEAAEEEGTYELAEQLLRQLITANPANPIYHEKLGYLFLKKNQQFMAFTELKSAAQEYLQNNQASQAVKIMRDYWAIDPDQVEVHQILAVAYEKEGDLHQAILEYARVIDEHLAMGDLAQAQPLYEKIKALNVEHRDVRRLRLTFEGRTIEPPPSSILVEPTYAQAPEEISPEPVESKEAAIDEAALKSLLTETEVYIKYGLVSKAVEQLEQVLEKNPDHVQAHLRLKEIYQVEGLRPQAVEECLKLAAIYKKQGDTEACDKAMKEAHVLDPNLAAQPESDQKEAEAEMPSAEAAAETSEAEDIEARMAEADLCCQRGLMAEAKKLYELILTLKPDHAGALAKLEDLVSADVQGREVDYETHYNLGIAYKEMGLFNEAIAEFKLLTQSPDRFVDSRNMLAACFQQKGMIEEAIQALEEALASPRCEGPQRRWLSYDLATLYERNDHLEAAFKLYVTIYGEDQNFKDVAQRLDALRKAIEKPAGGVKAVKKPAPAPSRKDQDKKKSRISYL